MADTGLTHLGALRIQAQQRSDQVNSNFITTVEWNALLTLSYKELYDLLVTSYGDDYELALPYDFTTSGTGHLYPLPDGSSTLDAVTGLVAAPFYKLVGVDMRTGGTPNGYETLRRFEFTERNRHAYLGSGYAGWQPRYKVAGANLWLDPVPQAGQRLRLWYVPKPTNLQAVINCGVTSASATVTTPDTTQLAVGMSVKDFLVPQGTPTLIEAGTTITTITPGVSIVMTTPALASGTVDYMIAAWSDATQLDGISGWEQYIIVDAAIKALIKEESDPSALLLEKRDLRTRIIETAANRDASQPARVSDTQSTHYSGFYGDGGFPW